MVVPVPDSGNYAALDYSLESKIPYHMAFVRNHYVGRSFLQPSQVTRRMDVRVKLNLVPKLVEGKRIISVNYSIVRGTTSQSFIQRNFLFADGRAYLDTRCYRHTWTLADQTTLRASTSNHHRILLGSSNSCISWLLFRAQGDEFHHLCSQPTA